MSHNMSKLYVELANTIARQAEAISADEVQGPLYAAVQRLRANVDMLAVWTPDDRS